MEMSLDPAAAHYRQRLQEAEDNCAILTVQLAAAHQEIRVLQEAAKERDDLMREKQDPELDLET